MQKKINKWMVSTFVVSVVSLAIIGILSYKLFTQPKMDRPQYGLMNDEDRQNGEQSPGSPPEMDQETAESSDQADI